MTLSMKMKPSIALNSVLLLCLVVTAWTFAQDQRTDGYWRLSDTTDEAATIATDDYEIVIRLGALEAVDEIWASVVIEMKNKSSNLLTLDPSKVFLVDDGGNPLDMESPLIRRSNEQIRRNEVLLGNTGALSDLAAERELREKEKGDRDGRVVVPPASTVSQKVMRFKEGALPRTLSLSIFGLQIGDMEIKLPILEFSPPGP